MDGDVLPCICRSVCSAANYDNVEVLGIQARNPLRYLHQEIAEDGCVRYADHPFVVALEEYRSEFGTARHLCISWYQAICCAGHGSCMAAEQGYQALSAH